MLAGSLLAAGCGGDTQDRATDAGDGVVAERVDSAQRFTGQKRTIAEAVEEYEAVLRAGDAEALCRRVLDLGRNRVEPATARCLRDQDNDALAGTAEAREALDLTVQRIALVPGRPRDVAGIPEAVPRYQVEWGLEDAPPVVALVDGADGGAPGMSAFGLTRDGGEWRIVSRLRARETQPPKGAGRVKFFRHHGVLGFYGIATSERIRCHGGREGGITHGLVAPRRARSVRDAVMRSNIGPGLRKALRDGATLHLAVVDYRGPNRTFTLKLASGRTVLWFDVYGPGPGYVTTGIWGCTGWIERMTHLGLSR